MDKSCYVFLLYRGICRFCALFGRFGSMAAFGPLGSAFEGHGSPSPVNKHMCMSTERKDDICTYISKTCMQILLCIGKLYHRLKKMYILESESRLFNMARVPCDTCSAFFRWDSMVTFIFTFDLRPDQSRAKNSQIFVLNISESQKRYFI